MTTTTADQADVVDALVTKCPGCDTRYVFARTRTLRLLGEDVRPLGDECSMCDWGVEWDAEADPVTLAAHRVGTILVRWAMTFGLTPVDGF